MISMSNLPANRKLTDKQQLFLDNILETKGDLKLSAELAGYSGNHYQVIKSLKEEIVELASNVLAREAPKAAFKLVEVMTPVVTEEWGHFQRVLKEMKKRRESQVTMCFY